MKKALLFMIVVVLMLVGLFIYDSSRPQNDNGWDGGEGFFDGVVVSINDDNITAQVTDKGGNDLLPEVVTFSAETAYEDAAPEDRLQEGDGFSAMYEADLLIERCELLVISIDKYN